ncbi:MAG: lactate dehydrogenase, partial [Nisaea sp.]|nr:lactate dehydrogenase [Nisaea sp.]
LARRRAALSDGLALYPGIMEGLAPLAATAGLSPPAPLT